MGSFLNSVVKTSTMSLRKDVKSLHQSHLVVVLVLLVALLPVVMQVHPPRRKRNPNHPPRNQMMTCDSVSLTKMEDHGSYRETRNTYRENFSLDRIQAVLFIICAPRSSLKFR